MATPGKLRSPESMTIGGVTWIPPPSGRYCRVRIVALTGTGVPGTGPEPPARPPPGPKRVTRTGLLVRKALADPALATDSGKKLAPTPTAVMRYKAERPWPSAVSRIV